MDKRSILGFVIIAVILFGWLYWSSTQQQDAQKQNKPQDTSQVQNQDTGSKAPDTDTLGGTTETTETISEAGDSTVADTTNMYPKLKEKFGEQFYNKSSDYPVKDGETGEKIITLENEKVIMEFTNYGGSIRSFVTKDFKTWDQKPVQLVDWKSGKELHLLFTSKDGKAINTRDLVFSSDYTEWQKVNIEQDSAFELRYSLIVSADSTQKITKIYTFKKDSYEFDVSYEIENSDKFITGSEYQVVWGSSLNLTEFRSDEEATFEEAFAYMGGELVALDASDVGQTVEEDLNGNTDYVSSRNKYFGVFIIPEGRKGDGAFLSGQQFPLKDNGLRKEYSIAMKMDIQNDKMEKSDFIILLAPLDYKILKVYDRDLQLTMRFPLDFIIRPIAEYFIIPLFNFIHMFVPNFGLVIIIFAVIMKIILNPLTKKQMASMKKMGELSPKMTAIREKYKDDPQKANAQIMNLYKEEKINPAGGCLPMLLQLPILYALFGVFRSTIELRQQPFILWIHDLAAPDVIMTLPFKIPLFGIDQVSGLALLMGITMFFQQKMTVTDPKQKAMVYVMPVMLTLLFFSFPSGLNLYYFMFNLLSIIQQYYTKKKDDRKKKEGEEVKVLPGTQGGKKGGWKSKR